MNIRGTDPAAIATVTDLFVITAPARDDGSNDFQRALQTKPAKPSEPVTKSSAPATTAPSQPAANADNQHQDDADEVNEVAQSSSESSELPTEEEADEHDVAAESLVAAANQVSQPQPKNDAPPVSADQLNINAEHTGDELVEATAGESINPDITAEQAPLALPTEQTATVTVQDQVTQVTANAEAIQEPIPEVEAATAEEQPTDGIGVLPSAVATTTAATGQSVAIRRARDGQDRSEHLKQSTSTGDATAAEATPEAATEPASGSRMVNPDKRNSQESPGQGEASSQAATPTPYIDPTATATMTQDSAANQTTPDATSAANKPQDPPILQSAAPNVAAAIVNRLPAQALVRHAASTTPEGAAPLHVDAAKFLQRVTKAFESAHERGGEIRLRLSPPELGALRVEVTMQDQGLVARLEVETNEARAVLLENLPVLRERLAEQGLRLERFDVDLARREPDQPGGHLPDQSRDRQSQPETRQAKTVPQLQPTSPNTTTIPSPTTGWQDRQLNVIV